MATEKINVCEVYEEELGEDEPIEYEGLTFYPVKIKNMYKLMRSVDVLLYDNLNYPDDELAGLPRLSFLRQMILRAKTEQDNLAAQVLALKLQMLFSIVFPDLETFSIIYPAQPKRDVFYFKMKNGKHVVITNKKFENIPHWLRSHGSMETKFKDMSDEVEKYKEKLKSI